MQDNWKILLYSKIFSFAFMKAAFILAVLLPLNFLAQINAQAKSEDPESMIKQIYVEVSSEEGQEVDWEKVRSFFVEEAPIILQTSRDESTRFTLEEFIQDFKEFYESSAAKGSGFKEEVLKLRSQVYADMAFIAVVYEASILNSDRPPQKVIDFWLLQKKVDSWKVVAVTNQIIPPGEEIPVNFEN